MTWLLLQRNTPQCAHQCCSAYTVHTLTNPQLLIVIVTCPYAFAHGLQLDYEVHTLLWSLHCHSNDSLPQR